MKQKYCYSQTQMIISKYKKVSQKQQIYEAETQQTKHYTLISMPVFQVNLVSRYKNAKPFWILLWQEMTDLVVVPSAIIMFNSSAHSSSQITIANRANILLFFYRSDVLPAAQPTTSKH